MFIGCRVVCSCPIVLQLAQMSSRELHCHLINRNQEPVPGWHIPCTLLWIAYVILWLISMLNKTRVVSVYVKGTKSSRPVSQLSSCPIERNFCKDHHLEKQSEQGQHNTLPARRPQQPTAIAFIPLNKPVALKWPRTSLSLQPGQWLEGGCKGSLCVCTMIAAREEIR